VDEKQYPVYYRIILTRENVLAVVTMQSFDEDDYNQSRFIAKKPQEPGEDEQSSWKSLEEARQYLNENFKLEFIHRDDQIMPVADPEEIMAFIEAQRRAGDRS